MESINRVMAARGWEKEGMRRYCLMDIEFQDRILCNGYRVLQDEEFWSG